MVLAGMQNTVKYLNKDNLSCLEFVLPDQTNAESAYMFSLGVRNILCSGRSLYEYKRESQTWSKLKAEMKDIRTEVGCISVKDGVIISGGTIWDYDGSEIQGSHCTDSVVLLQNDFSVVEIGKLPKPIKGHSMTKISDRTFVICGGKDRSDDICDVYCGMWDGKFLRWTEMKPLKHPRCNHGAMFLKDKLVILGGSHWTGSRKLSRSVEYIEIKKKLYTCQWKKGKDLPFDASNVICNVSCDGEYGLIMCKNKSDLGDKNKGKIAMMNTKLDVTLLSEEGTESYSNAEPW